MGHYICSIDSCYILDLISKCCSWHYPVTWFGLRIVLYIAIIPFCHRYWYWCFGQQYNLQIEYFFVLDYLYYRLILLLRYFQGKSTHITLFWSYILKYIASQRSKSLTETLSKTSIIFDSTGVKKNEKDSSKNSKRWSNFLGWFCTIQLANDN